MSEKMNLIRNVVILAGFLVCILLAFFVRGNLPESFSRYSGLIFFGIIILGGGAIGALAAKFIK